MEKTRTIRVTAQTQRIAKRIAAERDISILALVGALVDACADESSPLPVSDSPRGRVGVAARPVPPIT